MIKNDARGFTLAELLIALAILGVIATFTIPKILSSQQNGASKAKAKEVAAMISQAHQMLQQNGLLSSSTKSEDFMPYMNYVSYRTSGSIDAHPGIGNYDCIATRPCIILHNGGVLLFQDTTFSGTTGILYFMFDPDNVASGLTADGPSKSVQFALYYNGMLRTRGTLEPDSCVNGSCTEDPSTAYEPSWFSW